MIGWPGTSLRIMELQQLISDRNNTKNLSVNFPAFLYVLAKYGELSLPKKKNVLYVGVGHGLDMLTCASLNPTTHYVGVDPYIQTDGNDEHDFLALKDNSTQNIEIFRMKIEEYIANHNGSPKFDLIVISDCLHHIFVTSKSLPESDLAPKVESLFKGLSEIGTEDVEMLITEASRFNLSRILQWFKKHKTIDYRTKHHSKSWTTLISKSGWKVNSVTPYVPITMSAFNIKQLNKIWMLLTYSYYIHAKRQN